MLNPWKGEQLQIISAPSILEKDSDLVWVKKVLKDRPKSDLTKEIGQGWRTKLQSIGRRSSRCVVLSFCFLLLLLVEICTGIWDVFIYLGMRRSSCSTARYRAVALSPDCLQVPWTEAFAAHRNCDLGISRLGRLLLVSFRHRHWCLKKSGVPRSEWRLPPDNSWASIQMLLQACTKWRSSSFIDKTFIVLPKPWGSQVATPKFVRIIDVLTFHIHQMMYVSGETAEPSHETTGMVEEIVRQQVIEMVSISHTINTV